MNILIIEDQKPIVDYISDILQHNEPAISIDSSGSVKDALLKIKKHRPHLVFMDIELEDGTAFDILKQLKIIDFKIIFVTSLDSFALQAFKYNALNYILKPIDPLELLEAFNRAQKILLNEDYQRKFESFMHQLSPLASEPKKVILNTATKTYIVDEHDIIYCKADDNYVVFYLEKNQQIVMSMQLKNVEQLLSGKEFKRVHKSYIVNIHKINHIDKKNFLIYLNNNTSIPVSTKISFQDILKHL